MMTCCMIMHNVVVVDEGEDVAREFENIFDPIQLPNQNLATLDELSLSKCITHSISNSS